MTQYIVLIVLVAVSFTVGLWRGHNHGFDLGANARHIAQTDLAAATIDLPADLAKASWKELQERLVLADQAFGEAEYNQVRDATARMVEDLQAGREVHFEH